MVAAEAEVVVVVVVVEEDEEEASARILFKSRFLVFLRTALTRRFFCANVDILVVQVVTVRAERRREKWKLGLVYCTR